MSSRVTEFQQLEKSWTSLLNRLKDDPRVARLLNTRVGRYLSHHSFLALTVVLFSAMAALPVGLFLTFALVTMIMSAVGFVFFEGFLLFVGGLSLLWVLSGIALFSVLVSAIINTLHFTVFSLLNHYYPHLIKNQKGVIEEEERESEASRQKDLQSFASSSPDLKE